jgi:hypothetical protein
MSIIFTVSLKAALAVAIASIISIVAAIAMATATTAQTQINTGGVTMTALSFKDDNPKMGQKGMCADDTFIISAQVASEGTRNYDASYLETGSAEKNITAGDSSILLISGTEAGIYIYVAEREKERIHIDSIEVKRTISDEPSEDLPTVTFYGDTIYIKMCRNDKIMLTMHIFGDYSPLTYYWDGNEPVFGSPTDSVFVFIADNNTDIWYCYITDANGNMRKITVFADYRYPPELIVIVNPKMDLGKYYQGQQVEISVIPQYYKQYRFYQYENDKMVRSDSTDVPYFKTVFNSNYNTVHVSVDDTNNCRATDMVNIEILPLPNILILNDPQHQDANIIFPNFRVTVYNSWGLKVKDRSDGYGWDGTDRSGRQIESGTYFYFVEIKTESRIETIQGAVTVLKK